MRKNRPIEEYVAMLHIDIDTLQAVIRHIEIARALYQTKFVDIDFPNREQFLRHSWERLEHDIWAANASIKAIEQQIGCAKSRHERREQNRLWSKNFLEMLSATGEELPF